MSTAPKKLTIALAGVGEYWIDNPFDHLVEVISPVRRILSFDSTEPGRPVASSGLSRRLNRFPGYLDCAGLKERFQRKLNHPPAAGHAVDKAVSRSAQRVAGYIKTRLVE